MLLINFSWDSEQFYITIGDQVNSPKTYTVNYTNLASNNYGPFTPDMGNDYCGADSIYDIPICSVCTAYGCCDTTKVEPCCNGINTWCWQDCYGTGSTQQTNTTNYMTCCYGQQSMPQSTPYC